MNGADFGRQLASFFANKLKIHFKNELIWTFFLTKAVYIILYSFIMTGECTGNAEFMTESCQLGEPTLSFI